MGKRQKVMDSTKLRSKKVGKVNKDNRKFQLPSISEVGAKTNSHHGNTEDIKHYLKQEIRSGRKDLSHALEVAISAESRNIKEAVEMISNFATSSVSTCEETQCSFSTNHLEMVALVESMKEATASYSQSISQVQKNFQAARKAKETSTQKMLNKELNNFNTEVLKRKE